MKAAKDHRKIGDTYSWESAYEYQGCVEWRDSHVTC